MAREKIKNLYLPPAEKLEFVPTGCTTLDCALGGGWALGRIVNLVGDKSTSKTGLATEAVINFLRKFPDGAAYYRETEAAFLMEYAQGMGLPLDKVDFGGEPLVTVEDFYRDLDLVIEHQLKEKKPAIYIVDSLDALRDEAEIARDISKGSYGTEKAKILGLLFKKARNLERTKTLLLLVSQVRENIDRVAFGEKYRRSGSKALDFFASQIVWLAKCGELKRTVSKVERVYGIEVTAKVKKNKVAPPFRTCDFPFIFSYGVDDLASSIGWLKNAGRLEAIDIGPGKEIPDTKKYFDLTSKMKRDEYMTEQARVAEVVKTIWAEIDTAFMPPFGKYN